MKMTISETAKLSGVSVRTLHYYDEIGLLTPSEIISDTGYRYYDGASLARLQQILFYKELDFPLKEIVRLMNASDYNREEALRKQRELLQLKRKRLTKLISLLDANLKGDETMGFDKFDTTEIDNAREKYATEAADKWGHTDAYAQSRDKTAKYSSEDWKRMNEQMDDLLRQFAQHLGEDAGSEAVQKLVAQWQQYITDTSYDCTREILSGLGQMYIADQRFTQNMDKFGQGTAKLISEAIAIYCG